MKADNTPSRGMRDLLPAETKLREETLASIVSTYQRFGYQQLETPAIESIDRLTSGSNNSENQKLIFQILKRGLDTTVESNTSIKELVDLGLRFDLTVPLARYYANNNSKLRNPFRALQIGNVWRAERPQKGRYRQFLQCDIDIIGEPSNYAEIELLQATAAALINLGLGGLSIRVSDRRVLLAIAKESEVADEKVPRFLIALDKLDKIEWDGVTAELTELGLSDSVSKTAFEIVTSLSSARTDELSGVAAKLLPDLDASVTQNLVTTILTAQDFVDPDKAVVRFDPTLVRGMGYYTGQVFEIIHPANTYSVAGGGRYDNLIGNSLGREVPACGISFSLERVVELVGPDEETTDVAILYDESSDIAEVFRRANERRQTGVNVSIVARAGKFDRQVKSLRENGFAEIVEVKSKEG